MTKDRYPANRGALECLEGAPPRVVVVDDNPMTVKLLAHIFTEAGWRVDGYGSPEQALAELETFEPDLIITDFRMPRMNGPEFLLAAERIHEATPMMIMTAYDDDFVIQDMLRKASVPSISKAKGLVEVLAMARELVAVRQALKGKLASVSQAS